MNTKQTIKKILLTVLWIAISSGLLVLFIAAIGKKNKQLCSGYIISIKAFQDKFFIDKNDVRGILTTATGGMKGQPMKSFNLMRMEGLLEKNIWIKDAELYFDNHDILHINVTEREPVARIFSTEGNSFYIDSSGIRMPLSDNLSARVPVFTSFPDRKVLTNKDSMLLSHIKQLSRFIMKNPFWMAQVAQVDIVQSCVHNCWQFEMIPTIGSHVVKLGDIENLNAKFQRLFIFYNQVSNKIGFDKYSVIDVQYAGQVIGTKRGTKTASVDTLQLRYNIWKLLQQAKEMQEKVKADANNVNQTDSVSAAFIPVNPYQPLRQTTTKSFDQKRAKSKISSTIRKKASKPKQVEQRKPKAVMPKKEIMENR